jgi:hypothetical protein
MLHELGCSVIGPAGSAAAALTLIASEQMDGAVLDWNLGREDSSLVAKKRHKCCVEGVESVRFREHRDPPKPSGNAFPAVTCAEDKGGRPA